MSLQPISKLSATDQCRAQVCRQRVPNGWCCNLEAPSTEFSSGTRDQHVAAFGRTEMRPTKDVGDQRANVPEVCRASAMDTVEGGSSDLV